jgi:hypothetical protein
MKSPSVSLFGDSLNSKNLKMTRQHYLCIDVGEDGAILLAEQSKDSEASSSLAKSDQSSSVDASEGV